MTDNTPGFRGSETTSVEVTAYHRGDDPIIFFSDAGVRTFKGRTERDPDASITNVSTSKAMGASSGSFTVNLKPSEAMGRVLPDFRDYFIDDDWIDITFLRHGKPYHTMRGLIENIEESESVAGKGATSKAFTLTGRDFGCIFDKTQVWFNKVVNEIAEFVALNIFEGRTAIGDPSELVQKIIYGFMGAQEDKGRANWLLPAEMPGAAATFADSFIFNDLEFTGLPERICASAQLMQPNGEGIWQLAQEYSDSMFTELFCDLSKDGYQLTPGLETAPGDTEMMLFFRDKPFPNSLQGTTSPWHNLPILEVSRRDVKERRVARSTKDRFNAFFVSPQVYQEVGLTRDLAAPLWDKEDIRTHGMRPFNVESRFSTKESDLINLASSQRERVRDWHCLSAYYLSGTIALARLFPDARIGTRLRLLNESEERQEDYYIEQVDHSWSQMTGGRSTLGVTRGWIGGDGSLLSALDTIVGRYSSEGFG